MPRYFRYGGQVEPRIPATAPLGYRLSQEVYALDGLGACKTGPEVHPSGKAHYHEIPCGDAGDYMVSPGARLEVGPGGKLYETLGAYSSDKRGAYIAGVVVGGAAVALVAKKATGYLLLAAAIGAGVLVYRKKKEKVIESAVKKGAAVVEAVAEQKSQGDYFSLG